MECLVPFVLGLLFILYIVVRELVTAINTKTEQDVHFSQGRAYQDAGELELAIAEYTKSLEEDPTYTLYSANAFFYRGKAHQDLGHREQAIRDFEAYLGLCAPNAADREEAANRIEQLKAELA